MRTDVFYLLEELDSLEEDKVLTVKELKEVIVQSLQKRNKDVLRETGFEIDEFWETG